MPMCSQLLDWIWDAEQALGLVDSGLPLQAGTGSFPSSPSHSIDILTHMTYCLAWVHGKQARTTRLHCTCDPVCASSWSGKSTSRGGQACQSALYGEGRATAGRSRSRKHVITSWILGQHGGTTVAHRLPSWWHRWAFYIDCAHPGCVNCQKGNTPEVHSLDTHNKMRYATPYDGDHYSQGYLQVMLVKPISNPWSGDLHRENCNTISRRGDFV